MKRDSHYEVPDNFMNLEEQHRDFARRDNLPHASADAIPDCSKTFDRRNFLKVSAAAAAGTAFGLLAPDARAGRTEEPQKKEEPPKSRVVIITQPEVLLKGYMANPAVMREMLDRGVTELTGAKDAKEAWRTIAGADDFVAMKYNFTGAPNLHTHRELVDHIKNSLVKLSGLDAKKVVGYHTYLEGKYNELSKPMALKSRGLKTRLRRIIADFATCIINLPVLKAHWEPGVSISMKNHLGSVNNPADFHGWRPAEMPRSLPELNAIGPIRSKTRLIICDATRPLWAGGPGDRPKNRWNFNSLIFATDPVALDAVGIKILEEKREEVKKEPWPLIAGRQMVDYAEKIGLGNAKASRIDVIKITMV